MPTDEQAKEAAARARRALGDMLRRVRNEMGMTQAEYAERIGVDTGSYSRYESGQTDPGGTRVKEAHEVAREAGYSLFDSSVQPQPDASGHLQEFGIGKSILGKARKFFRIEVKDSERDEVICDTEHGMEDCSAVIQAYERSTGETVRVPAYRIEYADRLEATELKRAEVEATLLRQQFPRTVALVLRAMGYKISESQIIDD